MAATAQEPHPAPPLPPELPEAADPYPRWPVWYGPVALVCGFGVGAIGGLMMLPSMAGVAMLSDATFEDTLPALAELATIVQDVGLVVIALLLAARTARPRAWQFGLRPTRFWPALGWSLLALAVFWVFVLPLELLPEPPTEEISPDLGLAFVLVLGFVLIVVAPVAEEFFFRGFLYRSLRSHMPVLPAAVAAGSLFGAVHLGNGLIAVPLISVLGFIQCLVYERTGSLYPVIAIHSAHNTLVAVLAADAAAGYVFAGMGIATVAACVLVPAFVRPYDPLAVRSAAAAGRSVV